MTLGPVEAGEGRPKGHGATTGPASKEPKSLGARVGRHLLGSFVGLVVGTVVVEAQPIFLTMFGPGVERLLGLAAVIVFTCFGLAAPRELAKLVALPVLMAIGLWGFLLGQPGDR